ncbi:DUF2505 family protein [Hahella sp. SMD15-11]|uniref:DUF2505 family protein n=1 Tax=Thermohahella caldifontis TaxID=3142973 RepID=A0AB39UYE7_9GAMM
MSLQHTFHFPYPARRVFRLYTSKQFIEGRFAESGIPSPAVEVEQMAGKMRITSRLDIRHQLGKARYLLRPLGLDTFMLDYAIEWHEHSDAHMEAEYSYTPVGLNMKLAGTLKLRETIPGQSTLEHRTRWDGPLSGRLHQWLENMLVERVHKEFSADMSALEMLLENESEKNAPSERGA